MKRAFGLAFTRSSACASSADQSYCLNPFQMSGYSQYGAPPLLIVFAAKKHLFVMPISPNCPVRSSSLLKLRYVTHSVRSHCLSKPTGAVSEPPPSPDFTNLPANAMNVAPTTVAAAHLTNDDLSML